LLVAPGDAEPRRTRKTKRQGAKAARVCVMRCPSLLERVIARIRARLILLTRYRFEHIALAFLATWWLTAPRLRVSVVSMKRAKEGPAPFPIRVSCLRLLQPLALPPLPSES